MLMFCIYVCIYCLLSVCYLNVTDKFVKEKIVIWKMVMRNDRFSDLFFFGNKIKQEWSEAEI